MRDENGNSKKIGFISYKTPEQANECIQKSTFILILSKQPYVSLAMSREQRLKAIMQEHLQQHHHQTYLMNSPTQNAIPMMMPPNPMLIKNLRSILQEKIIEKCPNNPVLLQR